MAEVMGQVGQEGLDEAVDSSMEQQMVEQPSQLSQEEASMLEQMEDSATVAKVEAMFNGEEAEGEGEGEGEGEVDENDMGIGGEPDENSVDTTEDFLRVFQGKTEFDSWDEFSNLFDEFQRVTGTAFKARSAISIEYANERRAKDKIADRFVYQTVKMVCLCYGLPVKKENSMRKRTKPYVGLGCEAMVHLRYKQGSLNIVSCNLEHKSRAMCFGNEGVSVRAFTFTDEVDFLIAKVALEHNPFICKLNDQEKQWGVVVAELQARDAALKTVNNRIVKKRVRFLIDRYMANINGKQPLPDDEMGIILFELAQSRQDVVDNPRPRGRPKRRPGRPRKYRPESDDDDIDLAEAAGLTDDEMSPDMKRARIPYTPAAKRVTTTDMTQFLTFLQRKDDADRTMRQKELDLRREELDLHKREMELQKSKFEFERIERQAHLDLLKAQLDAFAAAAKPKTDVVEAKGAEGITEYTIVVNNDEAFAQHAQAHIVQ